MTRKLRDFEEFLHEKLQNEKFAMAYLNAALAEEDKSVFLTALKRVIRAQNRDIASIAKLTDISRQNLYRILSAEGNPRWENITSIVDAMNLQINISPKHK